MQIPWRRNLDLHNIFWYFHAGLDEGLTPRLIIELDRYQDSQFDGQLEFDEHLVAEYVSKMSDGNTYHPSVFSVYGYDKATWTDPSAEIKAAPVYDPSEVLYWINKQQEKEDK